MKGPSDNKHRVSRREFGVKAASALAAAALAPPGVFAVGPPPPPVAGMRQDEQEPELPPDQKAEVDAKVQHIFAKWGDRLNDDQKKRMRTIVSGHVRMLQSIRATKVSNGDAPASVLKLAYPRGGKTKS